MAQLYAKKTSDGNPKALECTDQGKLSVDIANWTTKQRFGFEQIDLEHWEVVTAPGDVIESGGNTAGSGYVKISKAIDGYARSESSLLSKFTISPPFRIGIGMSMSQRLVHQSASLEVVAVDENNNVVNIVQDLTPLAISSIQQATTTLTVVTETAHGLLPGDHVNIYGVADSRLNYTEAIVATIVSLTSFTVTATTAAALTSVTAGPFNAGFVQKDDMFLGAENAYGLFWVGTATANAKYGVRANGGSFAESPLTSFGTACTVATVGNASPYCDSLLPAYGFDFKFKQEGIHVRSFAMNALTVSSGNLKCSRAVPDTNLFYKLRIRAVNNINRTRPVAKILTATKSGSTTATITTDVEHGLSTTDYVYIYGIRDQTNFANVSTAVAVASVIDPTSFTVVIAVSATATSYGGAVIKQIGSSPTSPIAQVVQSLSRTSGLMTLVGSATWAGLAVADTIQLYGLTDLSGQPLPYDGVYKVAALSTSSLVVYSAGEDIASVGCGGAVFKRTDFLIHFLKVFDYTRVIADIEAGSGSSTDIQESIPVAVTASASVAVTATGVAGTAAHDAAITGNPLRNAGRALSANYAAVATGDTADLITTLVGALIVRLNSLPQNSISASITVTDAADNQLFPSAGAGMINYITSMQLQNIDAETDTTFTLKDGSNAKLTLFLPKNMLMPVIINFVDPILMTAATAVNVACGTTGATVLVNAQGHKAP